MAEMRRILPFLALFFVVATSAAAFRDPALEKSLKTQMVKTFKKQAPRLKITTVFCEAPSSGITSHCTVHFTEGSVMGYYPVKATIHDSGQLSWTAQSPKCLNTTTKKYAAC